ncbi:MAG: 30S ribosomal protein S27ae [Candidatus Methanoplasma sp.]|jgi:small subunit ribosomal protein S27Ae|nr:30S ribosomal protein S27ae [Candidatus Methanoplasma sp.]
MAAPAPAAKKKDVKKAAGPKSISKRNAYKIDGGKVVRTKQACPKCGPGIFMATHKDRVSCGKCGYTEFKKS